MTEHPIILFDGVCNFCNGAINFVLRQDKKDVFRFAPLQSKTGQELLQQYALAGEDLSSFVLIDRGKVYRKSQAALRVMRYLPWYWSEAQVLHFVPRAFRDAIYDWIARNRYQWFGKKESCMVPTADQRSRFLS